jgi:hypothetical protein
MCYNHLVTLTNVLPCVCGEDMLLINFPNNTFLAVVTLFSRLD